MTKKNVYDLVTDRIINLLESGVIPWRKPWKMSGRTNDQGAMNWFTGRPYNGINQMLLGWSGEWATFNQISNAGGKVKKGEKAQMVVFFNMFEKEKENGEVDKIPVLKNYSVFEISQCEGLSSKLPPVQVDPDEEELDPIQQAEELVTGFMNAPDIIYKSGRAFYQNFFDRVSVPPMNDYNRPEEFYCTLYHELIHSTGHERRLNRKFGNKFGDENYSKEELVAEIGAAVLCTMAGIEHATIENSAAYIQNWLTALKNDRRMIVTAAGQAQKAVEYMVGSKGKKEELSEAS